MKTKFKMIMLYKIKNKMLFKYMIKYILIMFVLLIPSFFVFSIVFSENEIKTIQINEKSIENTITIVDSLLDKLDKIANKMEFDNNIMSYINVESAYKGKNVIATLELSNYLKSYSQEVDPDIAESFVYYTESNMLINGNKVYDLCEIFDIKTIEIEGIQTKHWENIIASGYNGQQIYGMYEFSLNEDANGFRGLLYTNAIGRYALRYAKFIAIINTDFIDDMILPLVKNDEGAYFILDKNGEMILSGGNTADISFQNIDEEKYIVSKIFSKKYGWEYVAVQSKAQVMNDIINLRNKVMCSMAIVGIVILLLTFLLSKSNIKPINELMDLFDKKTKANEMNEFDYIKQNVNELYTSFYKVNDKNTVLNGILTKQFFLRLINNEFRTMSQINTYLESIGTSIDMNIYAVCIIQILSKTFGGEGDIAQNYIGIKSEISKIIIENIPDVLSVILTKSYDTLVVIYGFDDISLSEANSELLDFSHAIQEHIHKNKESNDTFISIGGCVNSLKDINASYYDAQRKLNIGIWSNVNSTVGISNHFNDISNNSYLIDKEIINQFNNHIRAGEKDTACKELDFLVFNLIFKNDENFILTKIAINEITLNIIRLMEEFNINSEKIKKFAKEINTIDEQIRKYCKVVNTYICELCEISNNHKETYNNRLFEKIKLLIDDNIYNSNISLAMVADSFKISEVYLSTFFKKQQGSNFFEYIESARIEKAKILLTKTQMTILEISKKCGYNSTNTFSKAFRRKVGVSSSKYRLNTYES